MYAMVNQAKRTIFLYEAVEIKPTIGYNITENTWAACKPETMLRLC